MWPEVFVVVVVVATFLGTSFTPQQLLSGLVACNKKWEKAIKRILPSSAAAAAAVEGPDQNDDDSEVAAASGLELSDCSITMGGPLRKQIKPRVEKFYDVWE